MIVAERNKPVTFEVLVLPGFPNTYTVQSTGLNQGLLFSLHSACFRIEWVLGFFFLLRYQFIEWKMRFQIKQKNNGLICEKEW